MTGRWRDLRHWGRLAALFGVLLASWFALSQRLDPLFVAMGVGSALFATLLTYPLVFPVVFPDDPGGRGALAPRTWRVLIYLGWLLGKMVVASVQIAYFVLHPRMPLDPALLRFRTTLRTPMARAFVANTITLIPGTLTVDLEADEYTVHVFFPGAADDILSGELQNKVAGMFGEEIETTVDARWDPPPEQRR
jgi:multicomponent Na+:H+ antiporter subunit E